MGKKPSLLMVIVFLLFFIAILGGCMFFLKIDPHLPILLALIVTIIWGRLLGFSYKSLEGALIKGIQGGVAPLLILMLVGAVIAVWMMSGTVPTLLYFGVQLLTPEWFAISALTVCILVSTFTGSAFTTVGSVGVAIMGVGIALGVPAPLAAGAVVCGACFGDKMSPLSDTTNFAPAVAGEQLFAHIKHLMWTTVPALFITYLLFFIIGGQQSGQPSDLAGLLEALKASFTISWLTLLSPLLVVLLAMLRLPVLPVLVAGIVSGLLLTVVVQQESSLAYMLTVLQSGFEGTTGNELLDGILNAGGIQSMMWSISLVLLALALGGVIQHIGFIEALFANMKKLLAKRGHLIASTALASIGTNAVTGEQYLSILLPGSFFKRYYEQAGLAPKNLSRTLEDAGTLVNPLIPWGVSGAFFAQTLGVSVLEYAPFAFFLILSPMLTVAFGYLGIGIAPLDKNKQKSV
ncbi:Na+/H+ antiporter NhaC [Shouchella rhizosphaerae]|uniref:Na+/H+ antiporter NhaC n=1 Tax=Shouchella rhizosphaerae TaxID=866786 RepID=UPI003F7ED0C9